MAKQKPILTHSAERAIRKLGADLRDAGLADASVDEVGLMLEAERLPQRVRLPRTARFEVPRLSS